MFKRIIIGILINGVALFGVTYFIPDIKYTGGFAFFALGGLIMGILNSVVKPILKLLTFPLHILTMGLSIIILNGIIFWIFDFVLDTLIIKGVTMEVPSLRLYFFAGFIFGLINWVEHFFVRHKKS